MNPESSGSRTFRVRVPAGITRFIEGKLKLKVNRGKSKVTKVWECTYPGYIIGAGGLLRVAEASVEKLKTKVRRIARRTRPTPIGKVIEERNPGNGAKMVGTVQRPNRARDNDKGMAEKPRAIRDATCLCNPLRNRRMP